MRWRRRRSFPRSCLAQGCPSLPPMAVAQGESALLFPRRPLSPTGTTLFVGDFSSACRALRRWPILCRPDEPFAHSSLVRHLTSTGHPPSSPRYSTVLSRSSVVEAGGLPAPPDERRRRTVRGALGRWSIISTGHRSIPGARASPRLPGRAAARSWCRTAKPCPWQARPGARSGFGGCRSAPDCNGG